MSNLVELLSGVKSYRVAAYITAYQDLESVEKCVSAILNQSYPVEKIFIVDNSAPKLAYSGDRPNIIIESHPENIGVAAGLKLGLNWALKQGYDLLWTFDQDSRADKNCLKILLEVYDKLNSDNYQIGIIAASPINTVTGEIVEAAVFKKDSFYGCKPQTQVDYYECDAPITSGSLISLSAAQAISPPREELFIDGVDHDYGFRLKQQNFHNLIVNQAIIHHDFGTPSLVKRGNKTGFIYKYSALRHYYICRNHTYLATRNSLVKYRLISVYKRLKYLLKTAVVIIKYDSEFKLLKVWACVLGTVHGLIGKLGKVWY